MPIIVGITVIVIFVVVWFRIPYSPLKSKFQSDVEELKTFCQSDTGRKLRKEDFEKLPIPLQKYIEESGYIGTLWMNCIHMEYKNVDFMQGKNGPKIKIDYDQYNKVSEPDRLALIDSSMFGIPFQGYDYYKAGRGGMKGVIAKCFLLFHQTGDDMDRACLVTYMAESLFVPTSLLQDYFTFEKINDYQIKATISYGGQTVSGIFTFNEKYEYISFTTNDRAIANTDGTMEYMPWTAKCSDYYVTENGIHYPACFRAAWNYPEGDFVYFDGKISAIAYKY